MVFFVLLRKLPDTNFNFVFLDLVYAHNPLHIIFRCLIYDKQLLHVFRYTTPLLLLGIPSWLYWQGF